MNNVDNNRYRFYNLAGQGNQLDIFNEIDAFWGYGVPALSYELSNLNQSLPLTVRIHSPGGSVTEGLAISNLLRAYPGEVTTVGVGFVASIASVILLAGSKVEMDKDSYLMIHRPYGMQEGDADVMASTATTLRSMDETLLDIYMEAINKRGNPSQLTREQVFEMMKVETWMDAKTAKAYGFIDAIRTEQGLALSPAAFTAVAKYAKTPESIINQQKKEMSKTTFFDKLKALLSEADIQDAMPEANAPKAEEPMEEEEQDPIAAAIALLEGAGYTVKPAEAMEEEKKAEEDKEDEMAAVAQALAAMTREIKALKADAAKAKATPSGGNVPAKQVEKKSAKQEQFDVFAQMVKSKILQR